MSGVTVRPVEARDRAAWLGMREALWPEQTGDLDGDISAFLSGGREASFLDAVFVADRPGGAICGFAEATIRPFADACAEAPCAYLEGLWVDADQRRAGVASALVRAVEDWARGQGFTELGSDYHIHNDESAGWHAARGFAEVERLVLVRKRL
jgi:aminoglycoside 6'-N-acetyltransferase I